MSDWRSLFSLFGRRSRSLDAKLRLTQAYQAMFRGSPTREDQELVLADLANACSWRRVCAPNVTDAELRFVEGSRAAFARVFEFLSLSAADVKALEEAARRESAADQLYSNPL